MPFLKLTNPASTAAAAAIVFFAWAALSFAQGSLNPAAPSKEYVRLGGQVVAIENTVTNPTPDILLSPASLVFDTQFLATTGSEVLTIANTGSAPLKVTSANLNGANAADFSITANTCATIAADATCTITISFAPSGAGARTATLTIADNAPGSPQKIPLNGTGTATAPPPALTAYLGTYAGPPTYYSWVNQTFASTQAIFAGPTAVLPVRAYIPGGAALLTSLTAQMADTNDSVSEYWFSLQYFNGSATLQLTNKSTGANALASPMPLTISGDTVTLATPVSTGSLQLTAYRVALAGNEFQLDLTLNRTDMFYDEILLYPSTSSAGGPWVYSGYWNSNSTLTPFIASFWGVSNQGINTASGWLGTSFTVGAQPLTVTALGRGCLVGNAQTHELQILNGVTGALVPGASATVNMAGCAVNDFTYINLPTPIQLAPGSLYYLETQEAQGGDTYYPITFGTSASAGSIFCAIDPPNRLDCGSSYVEGVPNFLYYVTGSLVPGHPTVSVASPLMGATLSAIVPVTFNTASSTPITLQPQIDFANYGSPASVQPGQPYTFNWNSTTAATAAHTLSAVVTDTYGNVGYAPGVVVNVTNTLSGTTPLLTAFTYVFGPVANSGWFGTAFTVGAKAIAVSSLGRACAGGDSQTHQIKLVSAPTGDVTGGGVTLNMAGCPPGQISYSNLAAPITLPGGALYYVVSSELAGGDPYFLISPVTGSSGVTIAGGVNSTAAGGWLVQDAGFAWGAINLLYK